MKQNTRSLLQHRFNCFSCEKPQMNSLLKREVIFYAVAKLFSVLFVSPGMDCIKIYVTNDLQCLWSVVE